MLVMPVILAGQSAPAPADLYQRVRERVLKDIDRLPNFTCVQTVTRRVYVPMIAAGRAPSCDTIVRDHKAENPTQPLESLDRLRLDVAIADTREVFSWVGASRFESSDLRQLVGGGQTITGDFGSLLLAIFEQHPAMHFEKAQKLAGRRLFEYSYQTPADKSQYSVRVGSEQMTTAYEGSVFLDPVKADVVRVTARSAVLPDSTGYCQVAKQLNYARQRIDNSDALIPSQANSWAADRDGGDMASSSIYSQCREYVGESVLSFDDPDKIQQDGQAGSPKPASAPAAIPPGLPFDCRITTAIDSRTAAAGDRVAGVLRSPIVDAHGNVLAPSGSRVNGRLMGFVERPGSRGRRGLFEIEVQLRSLEINGQQVPLAADKVDSGLIAGEPFHLNDHSNVGRFVFREDRLHITYLDSKWITAGPNLIEPSR